MTARSAVDAPVAPRRREVAVGDVDGDALLAFRLQAVDQPCEIGCGRATIVRHDVGIDQEPADQRALAVVDAAAGDEAQQACVRTGVHQK